MAERSPRGTEREESGCMWGLISILNFRNVESNQKLIADGVRSKRYASNDCAVPRKKPEKLACFIESLDGDNEDAASSDCRSSMKKLIEEEMFTEQESEEQMRIDMAEKPSESEHRVSGRRDKDCDKSHANIKIEDARSEGCRKSNHQCSDRIVISKPATKNMQDSESDTCLSEKKMRPNERIGYRFLLSRMKQKLRHAIRGKHQTLRKFEQEKRENDERHGAAIGCSLIMNEMAIALGERGKNGDLGDLQTRTESEKCKSCNKEVLNVNVEANKHLTKRLSHRAVDAKHTRKSSVPRILGRILSIPDNLSLAESPGRNSETGSVTLTSPNQHESSLGSLPETPHKQGAQICISGEGFDIKADLPTFVGSSNLANEYIDRVDESPPAGTEEAAKGSERIAQENSHVSDASPEPCYSSSTQNDLFQIGDGKEEEDSEELNLLAEAQTPSPLEHSPSNSWNKSLGCDEIVNDILGQSSPVSVLEPLVPEDDASPTSKRSRFVEVRIQPLCIQFEENDSPGEGEGDLIKTAVDDRETVYRYVKAVMEASNFNWEELFITSSSLDQLLEPTLVRGIELFPNQLCSDQMLLLDCINEVLKDISFCHFGWSLVKPELWYVSNAKHAIIKATQEAVNWHLLPAPIPRTLIQIISKDMARGENWMNIRLDSVCIGMETAEAIFGELLEEIFERCTCTGPKRYVSPHPTEPKDEESTINS